MTRSKLFLVAASALIIGVAPAASALAGKGGTPANGGSSGNSGNGNGSSSGNGNSGNGNSNGNGSSNGNSGNSNGNSSGSSGNSSGDTGNANGNSGNANGNSGSSNSGNSNGNSSGSSGNSSGDTGSANGNSGNANGNSGNSNGNSGSSNGNSGNSSGDSGSANGNPASSSGNSGNSSGNAGNANGNSGNSNAGGNSGNGNAGGSGAGGNGGGAGNGGNGNGNSTPTGGGEGPAALPPLVAIAKDGSVTSFDNMFKLETGSFGTGYGVHWGGGTNNDVFSIVADVHKTDSTVLISSLDTFDTKGNGEAQIHDDHGPGLDPFTDIFLDFERNWGKVTFALKGTDATTFSLTVNGTSQFTFGPSPNCDFCGIIGSGENKFVLYAVGLQKIDTLAFRFSGDGIVTGATTMKQIRVGDVDQLWNAVPEPAAWALMILGFGGVGAMLRRRRVLTA